MDFTIEGNPDYGEVVCQLAPGEKLLSESGAMSRMDGGMELSARVPGGALKSLARKFLGGESFFVAEYQSSSGGLVALSPRLPGGVVHRKLSGETIRLTGGCFLAASEGIDIKTRFGGLKSMFSGEGVFVLDLSGHGDLFFNAYGAVIEREITDGLVVDTGHVVGWESSLDYEIKGMGGLKQTLFSGEGLVMRFSGQGKVWLQSRTLGETAGWLVPYLIR